MEHEVILQNLGNSYRETVNCLREIFDYMKKKYPGKNKGLFMANDTHANIMLNLTFREYGTQPDEYRIIGFDDSPIAEEAVIPISTVGQQIDKIAYEAIALLVEQMNERKNTVPNRKAASSTKK